MESLRLLEPRIRAYTGQGSRYKDASSSRKVIYCPGCGAPVVDSAAGRKKHLARFPKCNKADQVNPAGPL